MAVYTQLTEKEIQDFLLSYNLAGLEKAQGIHSGVENTNYLLYLTDETKLILTVFEKRVAQDDLPFFTGLMQLLAEKIPSPKPLIAQNGSIIGQLKAKPAIIVSFLEGKSTYTITLEHLTELGAYLARMHLAGVDYTQSRPNSLSISGWQEIFKALMGRSDEIAAGMHEELTHTLRTLLEHWQFDLPQGIIHADLFPDNVFFAQNQQLSGIIDFYFACNDFLAYDIAICLNAWCFEKDFQFNITKAKALLTSYNAVRPLSPAELDALPLLARGAALRFLLTRSYDWLFPIKNALVNPKDPLEYLKKLRFHNQVTHHREYGI